jgi:5-methylcytosine-specific restriction endonuclease McrA
MPKMRGRPAIPVDVQVAVFVRDRWICRWCQRPVVFSPVMRLLEALVKKRGYGKPLAYFHSHWSRRSAPLLDHLGAVVDHVEAYSRGGPHGESNFVTACNKCNARKNDRLADDYVKVAPPKPVRGKYGEPRDWDGLASLFLVLARDETDLTPSERRWLRALQRVYGA